MKIKLENLYNEDCMTALLKLPARSVDLVFAELPEDPIMWSKQIPMSSYIDHNGLHYEHDEYMMLMYIKNADFIKSQQRWDDEHMPGLWANLRRILTPTGVVVLLMDPYIAANVKEHATIPWRYNILWKTQKEMPAEKVLSVFSPVFPEKLPEVSDYRDALPYIQDEEIVDGTEAIHNSVWICPALMGAEHKGSPGPELYDTVLECFSVNGNTVLDLCMRSGRFGLRAAEYDRKFIGMEKDPDKFELAKSRLLAAR